MRGGLQELTVPQGLNRSLEDLGWENTYKSQKPGVVMRANALVVCGVSDGHCRILDDPDAVLHVFFRVVELVQRAGREEGREEDSATRGMKVYERSWTCVK